MVAIPALARPYAMIEDVVINKNVDGTGVEGLNIRVNVKNPGTEVVKNPVVTLWVRADWNDSWRAIKRWRLHKEIDPGQSLSHDYFAYAGGYVDPVMWGSSFQVKANVVASGRVEDSKTVNYP